MTDEDVLLRFKEAVGVGRMLAPVQPENGKTLYGWYATSKKDVLHVLDLLEPWMGRRRAERAAQVRERLAGCKDKGICKRGHALAEPNIYTSPTGARFCRECLRIRDKQRRKY